MAMGIVSDSDFESELERLNPNKKSESKAEIVDVNRGRGEGNVQVPNTLRKVIGEESSINGRASAIELAQSFGLSPSSVSAYANGATSTASYEKTPNKSHLDSAKTKVANSARTRLMRALRNITSEKLAVSSAKDCAGVAKDMAAVIRTMEPEVKGPEMTNNGPTFVFYSPQMRREEHFDTVYAKE